ncbi:MAG: hypothetical protein F4018_00610 [Acidobacteria bacterium]|nr:hypothetical protein [Acidobacteriota bacterium]MYK86966.1 hypothetical protein [Acidobacteriota bacterium]
MRVSIHDRGALLAVSPAALSAYARAAGWKRQQPYRVHSHVYVGEARPDIIVPRTERLGDYASVVADLIDTFASVAGQDQLAVYRSLVTTDRDVVRVRAAESEDGSVTLTAGVSLIDGAREMLLSAACSLRERQPVYRAGANREASDLLNRVRLGQTDHGSFVVTLLTPVVPPPMPALFPDPDDRNAPIERRMTMRLVEALTAVRQATERTAAGDNEAFGDAVAAGVSANLCEALVRLVEPFPTLDVGVSWAQTRPLATASNVVRFGQADAALLREAARSLRDRAPRPDVDLYGFVRLLKRGEEDDDGIVGLATTIDGQPQSVKVVLERVDYERAIRAHHDRAPVVLNGDLDRMGQRWRLLNPRLTGVIRDDGPELQDTE